MRALKYAALAYVTFLVAGFLIYMDGLRKSPDYLAAIRLMWTDE